MERENTEKSINYIIDCAGKSLDLAIPQVMGILNVTPDSYCERQRTLDVNEAVDFAVQMVADGAAIIDVGGEPTNPSLHPEVPLQMEMDRVLPVIERLVKVIDVPISVDTSKPEIMREVAKLGAGLINDVRGFREPGALETAAELGLPVCIMHMSYPHGVPEHDPEAPSDEAIVAVIRDFLQERMQACITAGVPREQIILDPGIGFGSFGKNIQQSFNIIRQLEVYRDLGAPVLLGISRKTFIRKFLEVSVEDSLSGTLAASVFAIRHGANILRVHDVKATVDMIKMTMALAED